MSAFYAEALPQDWDRLAAWLAAQGRGLDAGVPPRQFSGGLANLNYLVSIDGSPTVLRRPPAGPTAEGANDMTREWRVLSALAGHYPLAPRAVAFCADPDVLGAQFQLLEFRPGRAVRDRLPAGWAGPETPGRLTGELIAAMAALHALDPEVVGLGGLGRPEGFFGRQVEGWSRRAADAWDGAPPRSATAIVAWLRSAATPAGEARLLHMDLKFDNMLVDPATRRAVAVLDWDMATRGDPLFDLAVLLSYWIEPGDPVELHELRQAPSLEPGFPDRAAVAARYFAASGTPPRDVSVLLALARLRLAVAWQQLFRLYERGAVANPAYAGFSALARVILDWTADTLDRRPPADPR